MVAACNFSWLILTSNDRPSSKGTIWLSLKVLWFFYVLRFIRLTWTLSDSKGTLRAFAILSNRLARVTLAGTEIRLSPKSDLIKRMNSWLIINLNNYDWIAINSFCIIKQLCKYSSLSEEPSAAILPDRKYCCSLNSPAFNFSQNHPSSPPTTHLISTSAI